MTTIDHVPAQRQHAGTVHHELPPTEPGTPRILRAIKLAGELVTSVVVASLLAKGCSAAADHQIQNLEDDNRRYQQEVDNQLVDSEMYEQLYGPAGVGLDQLP